MGGFFNTNINYFGFTRPDSSDDIVMVKVPVINLLNEVEQLTIDFERDSIFNYISIKWTLPRLLSLLDNMKSKSFRKTIAGILIIFLVFLIISGISYSVIISIQNKIT